MLARGFSVCYSPLSLLKPKEQGVITRLKNSDRQIVDKLITMGINPGVKITLEQNFPSFIVKLDLTSLAIDLETASSIYVRLIQGKRQEVRKAPPRKRQNRPTTRSVFPVTGAAKGKSK